MASEKKKLQLNPSPTIINPKKNIITVNKTLKKCIGATTNFAKQVGLRSQFKFIEPENQKNQRPDFLKLRICSTIQDKFLLFHIFNAQKAIFSF